MVKLGSVPQHADGGQTDVIVSLCSLALMLCMVVVVLGIKFRWFKQRLSFEPIPTGVSGSGDNGQVVLTKSSRNTQEQFREPVVVQGIFRRKLDEDVIIERPKTLPPVRIRKTSRAPPSFGPPKRSETPTSISEQPVVVPPPPPPLPSASTVSLSSLSETPSLFAKTRARTAPTEDEEEDRKVDFNPSTIIISNGYDTNNTYEQLMTEDKQTSRPSIERRQTGYVRPSDELLQDLEREPPKVQPRRSLLSDKPEGGTFKKKALKATKKPITEPLKTEEEEIDSYKLNQRRLTGFFPPSGEDRVDIEDFAAEHNSLKKPPAHSVVFNLDDDDDDDDASNPPTPPPKSTSPPPPPPPTLFSSQISTEDEQNSSDNWSAIQRHRNLAREISEQHEAMQNRRRENAEASEFRNPLAAQQQVQPKPRTMRDMKRNNAKSDLLLDGERYDTEA